MHAGDRICRSKLDFLEKKKSVLYPKNCYDFLKKRNLTIRAPNLGGNYCTIIYVIVFLYLRDGAFCFRIVIHGFFEPYEFLKM